MSDANILEIGGKGRTVILATVIVILSVAMSGTGYLLFQILDDAYGEDEYKQSHNYSVDGTIMDGEAPISCHGTGVSRYASDTQIYRTYQFELHVSYGTDSKELRFGFICGEDGMLLSDSYNHIGDSGDCTIWERFEKGIRYTFHVGESSTVKILKISSETMSITATMLE